MKVYISAAFKEVRKLPLDADEGVVAHANLTECCDR